MVRQFLASDDVSESAPARRCINRPEDWEDRGALRRHSSLPGPARILLVVEVVEIPLLAGAGMEFTTPPSGSPEQPILVQVGLVAQQEGVVAAAVRVSMSNSSSTPPQQPTSITSEKVVQVVQVVRVRRARVALAS